MTEALLTPRGQRTRQALVDAATEVFVEKGLFDSRIADITDAAGLSSAAFYRYFETKNDIVAEAVLAARDRSLEALRPRGAEERSAPAFVRFAHANHRYMEAFRDYANVVRMLEQRVAVDESFRRTRRDWHPEFVTRLESGLRRIQIAGQIDPSVDVVVAAPVLSAMVENVCYVHFVLRGDRHLPVQVERTIHMLWGNVLGMPWDASQLPRGMRRPRPADVSACTPLPAVEVRPSSAPTPTSKKGIRTRARLLGAARVVFERLGYLDARVADIAAEADVGHGTFYNYFESRFDVFCCLAASLIDEMCDLLRDARSDGDDRLEVLRTHLLLSMEFYERNARMFAVLEQFASVDHDSASVRLNLRSRFVGQLARSIAILQCEGRADARLDPLTVSSAIVSTVDRSMAEWHVLRVRRRDVHAPDALVEMVVRSLQAAPSAS